MAVLEVQPRQQVQSDTADQARKQRADNFSQQSRDIVGSERVEPGCCVFEDMFLFGGDYLSLQVHASVVSKVFMANTKYTPMKIKLIKFIIYCCENTSGT